MIDDPKEVQPSESEVVKRRKPAFKETQGKKVGYRNPPRETQWKKGQSGNPSGVRKHKPKKKFEYAFMEMMDRLIEVRSGGRRKLVPYGEALLQLELEAAKTDPRIRRRVLDHYAELQSKWTPEAYEQKQFCWNEEHEELFRSLEGTVNTKPAARDNKLSSVTPGTGTPRTLTHDAAGNVLTDSRSGALGMTFAYDVEGRLASAYQTNSAANGGTYTYDFEGKLSSRTVTQSVAPTSTTTLYVYDLHHHVIAETNTSGATLREYIWLNDLPIAVVDNVNTTPVIYYVLTDHLGRPARVIDNGGTWVWDVIYSPFGAESYVYTNPTVMNLQFPGQYFQMEVALDNNWHRQYDPTLGRYLQPDPLINDDGNELIGGVPTDQAGLGASISDGLWLGNPKTAAIAPAPSRQPSRNHAPCSPMDPQSIIMRGRAPWRKRTL